MLSSVSPTNKTLNLSSAAQPIEIPLGLQGARDYLRTAFPLAHERLSVELVNGHTLLYTWPGSDQSLGMSHGIA